MAGENVTERIVRKVFSESLDVVVHVDRDDVVSGDADALRRQVVEIAAVVPALRDDFTVEPLFVRDELGAPAALDRRAPAVGSSDAARRGCCRGASLHAIVVRRGAVAVSARRRALHRRVLRAASPAYLARASRRASAAGAAEASAVGAQQLWLAQAGVRAHAAAVRGRVGRGRRGRVRRGVRS